MNNETVKCLICNKTFKQITATHLAKEHAITVAAYRKMFPTTSLVAKDISKKISESAKILCKNNIIGFKKNIELIVIDLLQIKVKKDILLGVKGFQRRLIKYWKKLQRKFL